MKESMKDNCVYIEDMLNSIDKIYRFTNGLSKEEFICNEMRFDAVIRNLEIIGEAASKLTDSFREENREVEWRKLIGMRNRVIHVYDMVDPDIVWDVVRYDLAELKEKLSKYR